MRIAILIITMLIAITTSAQTNMTEGGNYISFDLGNGKKCRAYECFEKVCFGDRIQITDDRGKKIRLKPGAFGFENVDDFCRYLDQVYSRICPSGSGNSQYSLVSNDNVVQLYNGEELVSEATIGSFAICNDCGGVDNIVFSDNNLEITYKDSTVENINLCEVMSIIVNAGDSSNSSDDANGSTELNCDEILHFYSSDNSINVSVVSGSAIIDLDISEEQLVQNIISNSTALNTLKSSIDSYYKTTDISFNVSGSNIIMELEQEDENGNITTVSQTMPNSGSTTDTDIKPVGVTKSPAVDNGDGTYTTLYTLTVEDIDGNTLPPITWTDVDSFDIDCDPIPVASNKTNSDFRDIVYTPYFHDVNDDWFGRSQDLQVVAINPSGNTATMTLNRTDFNGEGFETEGNAPWVGYNGSSINPRWTITNFDSNTGEFTIDISTVGGGAFPAVGENIELQNPYAVYENIKPDNSPINLNITSLEGKSVSRYALLDLIRMENGTWTGIVVVEFTDAQRRAYITRTDDLINFTTETTAFDPSPPHDRIYHHKILRYTGDDYKSLDAAFVIFSYGWNSGDGSFWTLVDKDFNIVKTAEPYLPPGYNSGFRFSDIVFYQGRWRLTGWERSESNLRLCPMVEYVFGECANISIDEILAGTASVHKRTVLHIGSNSNLGFMEGHSDGAYYFIYKDDLYYIIDGTELVNSGYIVGNNRQFGIGKLLPNGEFDFDGRPFLMNGVEWQGVDSQFQWQRDHTGPPIRMYHLEDGRILLTFMKNNGSGAYQSMIGYIKRRPAPDSELVFD